MIYSKHNIASKLKGSDEHYIVNVLAGAADIVSEEILQQIKDLTHPDKEMMLERGYWTTVEDEDALLKSEYLDFVDNRDSDEVQLFFVPWYACNFTCSYCFQDEYTNPNKVVKDEVMDAFFSYIDEELAHRRKYITIFGGEPLLKGENQKAVIRRLMIEAKKRNLDIAIVTNGYTIAEYMDEFKLANIREIQVTIDGDEEAHDKRRQLKNGSGTFKKIAEGVDLLLENNIAVNLRMVVDKDNLDSLPRLSRYAIDHGWTKHPLFKTQLGRNYELHHCQVQNERLYTRLGLYERVYELVKKHPEILEFYQPAFSISKFLFENGELPQPLFDSCPATKTEWAFDYTGKIYPCTAMVGKEEEELGTFYPERHLNEDRIEIWEDRDVLSITKCSTCNLALACGGGCGAVAKNWSGGIQEADCRPVKELIEMGIEVYND